MGYLEKLCLHCRISEVYHFFFFFPQHIAVRSLLVLACEAGIWNLLGFIKHGGRGEVVRRVDLALEYGKLWKSLRIQKYLKGYRESNTC